MGWRFRTLVVQVLRCCRNTVWPWTQSPLLVVAVTKTTRPRVTRIHPDVRKSRSSRVRQTKYNEKQIRRTKQVATCPGSLARLRKNSTTGWVNCAMHKAFGALRHQDDCCRLMLDRLPGVGDN